MSCKLRLFNWVFFCGKQEDFENSSSQTLTPVAKNRNVVLRRHSPQSFTVNYLSGTYRQTAAFDPLGTQRGQSMNFYFPPHKFTVFLILR